MIKILLLWCLCFAQRDSPLQVKHMKRDIRLKDTTVEVSIEATLHNTMTVPSRSLQLCLPKGENVYGAVEITVNGEPVVGRKFQSASKEFVHYEVHASIPQHTDGVLRYRYSISHPYRPMPDQIQFGAVPTYQFNATEFIPFTYTGRNQITEIHLPPGATVIRYPASSDFDSLSTVTYKSGASVIPHQTGDRLEVVFMYGSRDATLNHLTSTYALEGSYARHTHAYKLVNNGPSLLGSYPAYAYSYDPVLQMPQSKPHGLIEWIEVKVPITAYDADYRDILGNVTTSSVINTTKNWRFVRLYPRYPLLGGWSAELEFSYSVPLVRSGGEYHLELDNPFAEEVIDQRRLIIQFPEGSNSIQVDKAWAIQGTRAFIDMPLGHDVDTVNVKFIVSPRTQVKKYVVAICVIGVMALLLSRSKFMKVGVTPS